MNASVNTLPTFPEKLKQNTSVPHTQLEELPLSKAIISPDVNTEDYLLYLDLMQDIIYEVENIIYPKLSTIIQDIEERRKNPLIEADFSALSYTKNKPARSVLNLKDDISTGYAMGIMYVIEGSTLGGRVLYKNIEKHLGYNNDKGAAYFAGYGDKTGSNWKNFMLTLSNYENEHGNADDIIAGANHAFTSITKHFTENSAK